MSVSDVNSHFVISIYCKALKISGLGSTLESVIDFLIQALRRLGSDCGSYSDLLDCWGKPVRHLHLACKLFAYLFH